MGSDKWDQGKTRPLLHWLILDYYPRAGTNTHTLVKPWHEKGTRKGNEHGCGKCMNIKIRRRFPLPLKESGPKATCLDLFLEGALLAKDCHHVPEAGHEASKAVLPSAFRMCGGTLFSLVFREPTGVLLKQPVSSLLRFS